MSARDHHLFALTAAVTALVVLLIWAAADALWLMQPICSNPHEGCRHSQQVENTLAWHDITGEWRCSPDWLFSCP